MDDGGFWTALSAVFIAELGDKTQLGVLLATARLRRPGPIFLGASLALLTSTALATAAGALAGEALPTPWLQVAGGVLFVVLGALTLWDVARGEGEAPEALRASTGGLLGAAFAAIFLAEMGDKTQLMTATLASAESAGPVAAGAGLALVLSTALAVLLGLTLARFPERARLGVHAVGGALFVGFGIWYLLAAAGAV